MRGLFVTGTGTGVGKTIVSAALLAAMRAAGKPVRAYKPIVTGLAEPPDRWPADHELLALAAGVTPEEVTPLRFDPPVSPHLAAALVGQSIDPATIVARACIDSDRILVVEGLGGLLVPLTEAFTVRDLAVELGLPLVIAAATGLGTINHTLLTIEAARAAGLSIAAIVLTPWPGDPSEMERSNRETIARLGEIDVATLSPVRGPELNELAQAGDSLPWRDWL
ncbi:MAG TPA: dethiobiotin synthase [Solirubrobacteraceae bacterium]|jgi:dethiobiotin synthetase|nr:dethiobiotin synthase [Solirubrobacteraceae bacterium]